MSPPKQTTSRIVIMPFRATCFKIAFHFSLLFGPRVLNGDLDFSSFLVRTLTIKFALMNIELAHFIAQRKVRKEGSLAERATGIGKNRISVAGLWDSFLSFLTILPSVLFIVYLSYFSLSFPIYKVFTAVSLSRFCHDLR